MTLAESIHTAHLLADIVAQQQGLSAPPSLLVALDGTLRDLWQRATADPSFHLGKLYVLRTPLMATIAGQYERHTGDVAIVWHPDDPAESYRILLHELAHAQRPPRACTMVDAHWEDEQATERAAHALADTWGSAIADSR